MEIEYLTVKITKINGMAGGETKNCGLSKPDQMILLPLRIVNKKEKRVNKKEEIATL